MIKKAFFICIAALVVFFLGRHLAPGPVMFDFHDESQPARISEFTFDIKHLQIPPRIAPHFSFNLGYPVFNFYAPFSYWVTSSINILGFDVADSLKLSFLLALLIGYFGMYVFLRLFFNFFSSLLGASLFVSAPYIALEIFIRGNLAEIWLIALIPWVFYFVYKNSSSNSKFIFIATSIIIACAVSAHNILSIVLLPWIIIYLLLLKNKKRNLFALILGLLLSSYYLLPAALESSQTYATQAATRTNYADHFLCLQQIWSSPWGYGGSVPGCVNDGLSFMIGKIQILLALAGSLILLLNLFKRRIQENKIMILVLLLTLNSIYLSLYQSAFIWHLFSPIFALFQFPWRFLALAVFGDAVLGAYLFSKFKHPLAKFIVIVFIILPIVYNAKFFTKFEMSKQKFNDSHLTALYISDRVAYKIPEYLPRTVDYKTWLTYEPQPNGHFVRPDQSVREGLPISSLKGASTTVIRNTEYDKIVRTDSKTVIANIHYFPFWKILINDQEYQPQSFDLLGRPIIPLSQTSTIQIIYKQTRLELLGNIMTLITIFFLLVIAFYKPLWNKLKNSVL